MSRKLIGILITLLLAAFSSSMAGELEELLAKHYQALGGTDLINTVKSIKATGKLVITSPQGEFELPLELASKGNDRFRIKMNMQGMDMVQATDGKQAWTVNPMMGSNEPQDMNKDDASTARVMADLLGDLVNYKEKGYKLEYSGAEDVEGSPTHKITVIDGENTRHHYLDTEYYLIIKSTATLTTMGSSFEMSAFPSGYKPVNGFMMAHARRQESQMGEMVISLDSIEINPQMEDSEFTKPAATETLEEKK